MEWRPAGWSVCHLIFTCTINSRSSLLAPAHTGGPGKRAVKRLLCCCFYLLTCSDKHNKILLKQTGVVWGKLTSKMSGIPCSNLPWRTFDISAQRLPSRRCRSNRSRSSASVHAVFFTFGFRWLCHLFNIKEMTFPIVYDESIHQSISRWTDRSIHQPNKQSIRRINFMWLKAEQTTAISLY